MTIEIIVSYEKSKLVEVPEDLAKILVNDGCSDEFDEWVAGQAYTVRDEEPLKLSGTMAYDIDTHEMVYDVS